MAELLLFTEKYRPRALADMDFNRRQSFVMEKLSRADDFPHLLVYGPCGSGKKTRVAAMLRAVYGDGVDKVSLDSCSFETPSGKKVEINVITSAFHIELNAGDAGVHDRVVVQEVVKRTASTKNLYSSLQKSFKVVVLNEAEKLTKEAQNCLRRTMEKYAGSCRLVLVAEALSMFIPPLISRCLCIGMTLPDTNEIFVILENICRSEAFADKDKIEPVVNLSENNLTRALLSFQVAVCCANSRKDLRPGHEICIEQVYKMMKAKQTPDQLMQIRSLVYELLVKCIHPVVIFKRLLNFIILDRSIADSVKMESVKIFAAAESLMNAGSKPLFHIESCVVDFMRLL